MVKSEEGTIGIYLWEVLAEKVKPRMNGITRTVETDWRGIEAE